MQLYFSDDSGGAFIWVGLRKGSPPLLLLLFLPPIPPPLLATSFSSLRIADNRGSLLHCQGKPRDHPSQPADYRHSLAGPWLLRRGERRRRRALVALRGSSSSSNASGPSPLLLCIVFTRLTDTEPVIISFPQGPAAFVWQTLQTLSILFFSFFLSLFSLLVLLRPPQCYCGLSVSSN